jgi:hypothetical protein
VEQPCSGTHPVPAYVSTHMPQQGGDPSATMVLDDGSDAFSRLSMDC